jgi:hypothetical protein
VFSCETGDEPVLWQKRYGHAACFRCAVLGAGFSLFCFCLFAVQKLDLAALGGARVLLFLMFSLL